MAVKEQRNTEKRYRPQFIHWEILKKVRNIKMKTYFKALISLTTSFLGQKEKCIKRVRVKFKSLLNSALRLNV